MKDDGGPRYFVFSTSVTASFNREARKGRLPALSLWGRFSLAAGN